MLPCAPRLTFFPYTTLFRSLKAGIQATFYTTGWIFGRGVAVREVGHEPGQSPVVTADAREAVARARALVRSEEHTSELQSHSDLVCRLLLEKKKEEISKQSS